MLEELHVRNLLIIDKLSVRLGPGLNVISGETGVGKSLLLSSVGLLLGGKLDKSVSGDSPRVEGRFQLRDADKERLSEFLEDEDDELVIRVSKKDGGAQRCYVNGSLAARKELGVIASSLVDLHGQRDTQNLLKRKEQIRVLDSYSGCEKDAASFRDLYHRWQAAQKELLERERRERALRDRLDLVRYQEQELREAAVEPGELTGLEARSKLLRAATETTGALNRAGVLVDDDENGVVRNLNAAGAELERLAEDDPALRSLAEQAFALAESATELARDMTALGQERSMLDDDPAEIDERLNLLHTLCRKYHTGEEGLVDLATQHAVEIEKLDEELANLGSLDETIAAIEADLLEVGGRLAARRARGGKKLSKLIEQELKDLRMPKARFVVAPGEAAQDFDAEKLGSDGFGDIGFLVCTNPGASPSPLENTASGGELSRILLAMKCVLAGRNNLPLLIFDEIEAGVGPRLGMLLGSKLKGLSTHRQVLCITHLPQIAAFADRHLKIDKIVRGQKTSTVLEEVTGKGRLDELASMLGGGDEKLARTQAKSLLGEAETFGQAADEQSA